MRDDIENALEQLDLLERAVRLIRVPTSVSVGTYNAMIQRDIDTALRKARHYLEDALPHAPVRRSSECTGIAATWCSVHGDCTCPKGKDGGWVWIEGGNEHVEDENCPLHGRSSNHAEKPA